MLKKWKLLSAHYAIVIIYHYAKHKYKIFTGTSYLCLYRKHAAFGRI